MLLTPGHLVDGCDNLDARAALEVHQARRALRVQPMPCDATKLRLDVDGIVPFGPATCNQYVTMVEHGAQHGLAGRRRAGRLSS